MQPQVIGSKPIGIFQALALAWLWVLAAIGLRAALKAIALLTRLYRQSGHVTYLDMLARFQVECLMLTTASCAFLAPRLAYSRELRAIFARLESDTGYDGAMQCEAFNDQLARVEALERLSTPEVSDPAESSP